MAGSMLGTAYVQIEPQAKGIKGSISNVLGGEAETAGTSLGGKIGSFAKKAIIAAGIGAVAVKGIKAAMSEGAKLQQSYLGGVDTLYGKAAEQVRAYAREASKAGISMNDYSEQAVSFGAALKQAFGGDVTKAAKAANTAIMDMADNSAKMGTDIESVQMAYQGFAKQNYTMLDNLKLGYGGTKTEMERLLADAEKLSGQTYSIDNLGDVYEAIHVIQGELGLAGVAADEASETFSGSFNAMKASVQNALGSIALGENVAPALQQLAQSVSTFFFGNFIPMLGTLIQSLPSAIVAFLQTGIPLLLGGLSTVITNITTQIKSLADGVTASGVAEWAATTLPQIVSAAVSLVGGFAKTLITSIPQILLAIVQIGASVASGLLTAIGSALDSLKALLVQKWNNIKADAERIWNNIKAAAKTAWDNIKTAIKEPVVNAVGELKEKWNTIKTTATSVWDSIKAAASTAWSNIKTAITKPIEDAKEKVSKVIDKIKGLFPLNLGKILNFSLPSISVSAGKAPWGIAGKGTPPKFSVSWASHAAGGIFTKPTLLTGADGAIHQVGEAGPEAILPLSELWRKMEEMQSGPNETNIVININGANKDPKVIAEEVKQALIRETNQRRLAWQ